MGWLISAAGKQDGLYERDVAEFSAYTCLKEGRPLRTVVRTHLIAWRKDMERRGLSPASIRHKLSALSSLFDYLCERNAVIGNPVDGVKRPAANGMRAARRRSATPWRASCSTRLRPICSMAFATGPSSLPCSITGIRREELCLLRLTDMQGREGVMHFRIQGECGKIPFTEWPCGSSPNNCKWQNTAGG